jgi:hypothetical protein
MGKIKSKLEQMLEDVDENYITPQSPEFVYDIMRNYDSDSTSDESNHESQTKNEKSQIIKGKPLC